MAGYWTAMETLALLVLRPSDLDGNCTSSGVSSLPTHLADLGILGVASFHNFVSQFLIKNLLTHIYIYIHIVCSVSLKNSNIPYCYDAFSCVFLFRNLASTFRSVIYL